MNGRRHGCRSMRFLSVPIAALCLGMTACSSGGASPPSAMSMAQKIPGCGAVTVNIPVGFVQQDVSCQFTDSMDAQVAVEIATFASSSDEQEWISDGGSPQTPDPGYGGCCVQGNGWAATVFSNAIGDGAEDFAHVLSAIGGREVTG